MSNRQLSFFSLLIALMLIWLSCRDETTNTQNIDPPKPDTTQRGYLAGDFHQHTTFTDGSWSFDFVMYKNYQMGLNWWINSEHGGAFARNGILSGADQGRTVNWSENPEIQLLGDGNSGNMWRWQCLRDFSFPQLVAARSFFPGKIILQGFEWNVPGHEHASVGIVTGQFAEYPSAVNLAQFEYMFEPNDLDTQGDTTLHWIKNTSTGHQKALEAVTWLQQNFKGESWVIPNHPERQSLYTIADLRDLNNAAPDVCFGFEGIPGHQKGAYRGMYSTSYATLGNCTYGGAGIMAAQLGGTWDAMLSEGRHWWLFANSDFHDVANDFYPGEYAKNYVYVSDKANPLTLLQGMKNGNVYVVTGNLIDSMQFTVDWANMGDILRIADDSVRIKIKVHVPDKPNGYIFGAGAQPKLDHIDLIAGPLRAPILPNDPNYQENTIVGVKVIARFDSTGGNISGSGLVSNKWISRENGWKEVQFTLKKITSDMYLRLRGSNLPLNTPNETDADGNPLPDDLQFPNNAQKAFSDAWFYSNPIFVKQIW